MAAVVNFIDATLRSAPSRTAIYGPNVGGFLTLAAVTLSADSAGSVGSFALASGTFMMSDAGADVTGSASVTYSVLSATGCTVAITAAGVYSVSAMSTDTAAATFRAVYGGIITDRRLSLSKARAGAGGTGSPGVRGAGQYYASGSAWSDTTADAACPGGKVVGDTVTISNGATYIGVKQWNGSAWTATTPTYDGGAIFPGTVTSNQINSNGLSIRDTNGNVIISAGSSLAQQTRINTNLIPRLSSWPASSAAGGAGVGNNTNDNRFLNGEFIYLPNSSGYVGITTGAIGIPANSWYTVSFDAYCTSTSRTLNVDVYGGGIDSVGTSVALTNMATRYTFTEQMPNSGSATSAVLRVFCVSGGSDAVVSNVKVEFGLKDTAWCDNVITKQNVTTFIQGAAIGLALIDTASIGQLSALSAYLGTVDIGPSGHIASGQTDYNVGNGVWIGGSNAPRMSMRTANGNTFLCDPANNVLQMNGGTISNPTITGTPNGFSINVGADMYSAPAQRVTSVTLGSRTVSVTGGQGALTYSWAALNVTSDATGNIYLTGANTATVTVRVTGTAGYDTSGQIQCTVTDGAAFSKTATFNADVTFS